MKELIQLIVGICILGLGWLIGILLARATKEELGRGKKWFRVLIIGSLVGSLVSLILREDALMFSFLFIAIVTSRSLKR